MKICQTLGSAAWYQDSSKHKKYINKKGECEVEHEESGKTQINEACENALACTEKHSYIYFVVYSENAW